MTTTTTDKRRTTAPPGTTRPVRRPGGRRFVLWIALAVAAGTLGTLAVLALTGQFSDEAAEAPQVVIVEADPGPAVGTQEFLYNLAIRGLIPMEAVDVYELNIERLVAGHLLRPEALAPQVDADTMSPAAEIPHGYGGFPGADELLPQAEQPQSDALRDAVNGHLIPPEALESSRLE